MLELSNSKMRKNRTEPGMEETEDQTQARGMRKRTPAPTVGKATGGRTVPGDAPTSS